MRTFKFRINQFAKASRVFLVFAFLALGAGSPADAALYQLNFNDSLGDTGLGQIDVVGTLVGTNYNYVAVSGYLDVTGGGAAGNWALYTAAGATTYPGYFTSPAGAYVYNNAVYPDGNNPEYPNVSSLLDNYGLLFTQGNGNELNLWGNPDGSYTLGGNVGGWQNFNVAISIGNTAGPGDAPPLIISPAPEPAALALFLIGGVALLAGAGRKRGNPRSVAAPR